MNNNCDVKTITPDANTIIDHSVNDHYNEDEYNYNFEDNGIENGNVDAEEDDDDDVVEITDPNDILCDI